MKQWYSSGSTYPWILNCSRLTSGFLEWCGLRMFHAWRCWPWDCGQGTDNSLALDLGECCRCSGHSCLRIEILKLNTWHRVVRVIQWYSLTTLSSWCVLIFETGTYITLCLWFYLQGRHLWIKTSNLSPIKKFWHEMYIKTIQSQSWFRKATSTFANFSYNVIMFPNSNILHFQ